MNEYAASGAIDHDFGIGDELFVSIDEDTLEGGELAGSITEVKRDQYTVAVGWIFILSLLIVGKKQGFYSLLSVTVNAILLAVFLGFYIRFDQIGLLAVSLILALFFRVISLSFVNGFNHKTYAAMVITYMTMWLTAESGLYYEAMQYLTRPPQMVFMAGILIGSLGAVMDVAITISSSIFNLYEKNSSIIHELLLLMFV